MIRGKFGFKDFQGLAEKIVKKNPVDGSISLLLAAGTFFCGRKLLKKESKEN